MTVTRMGLWIGQVVQPSDLDERFQDLGESEGMWRINESGLLEEIEWFGKSGPSKITLDQSVQPEHLFANIPHDGDSDAMILGVEVSLPTEDKVLIPNSRWYNGDVCFDITHLALISSDIIQSRIDEVTKLLCQYNLPYDRVVCLMVAIPKT